MSFTQPGYAEAREKERKTKLRRMYFAVCRSVGTDSLTAKRAAKVKYGVDSFTEITSKQLEEIMNEMEGVEIWK